MNAGRLIMGGVVLVLGVANVLYWWPDNADENHANGQASMAHKKPVNIDALRALEYLPVKDDKVIRDLFNPVEAKKVVQKPAQPTIPIPRSIERPVPEKKPEYLESLDRFRLAGVVERNGVREAYLLEGKTPLVARVGEALSQSVNVESIEAHAVILKDSRTGFTKRLALIGE